MYNIQKGSEACSEVKKGLLNICSSVPEAAIMILQKEK